MVLYFPSFQQFIRLPGQLKSTKPCSLQGLPPVKEGLCQNAWMYKKPPASGLSDIFPHNIPNVQARVKEFSSTCVWLLWCLQASTNWISCHEACGPKLELFAHSRICWQQNWWLLCYKGPPLKSCLVNTYALLKGHHTFSVGTMPNKQMEMNLALPENKNIHQMWTLGTSSFPGK